MSLASIMVCMTGAVARRVWRATGADIMNATRDHRSAAAVDLARVGAEARAVTLAVYASLRMPRR